MRIAISGCGVAGPTLAFWLKRYGFEPVLFEKAASPRKGGYVIDFWGPGFDVAHAMGLIPRLQADAYHMKQLRTVTASGRTTTAVPLEKFTDLTEGRYFSIARSALAQRVLEACENVETRFDTTIRAVTEQSDGLDLTFADGTTDRFDLLIGADGLHSGTRARVFGPAEHYVRPMGLRVAAFTLPGYSPREEGHYVMYTRPGRQISRATLRNDRTLFMFVYAERLVAHPASDPRDDLRAVFSDIGWEAENILARLNEADDFYADSVSQVVMPGWTKGRVALLGDAAACISLLGGEGTGLAMTGAYVLAGELARARGDYGTAFAAYERIMRPLLERKQANARRFTAFFAPPDWTTLILRDALNLLVRVPVLGRAMVARTFTTEFNLPDYGHLDAMVETPA